MKDTTKKIIASSTEGWQVHEQEQHLASRPCGLSNTNSPTMDHSYSGEYLHSLTSGANPLTPEHIPIDSKDSAQVTLNHSFDMSRRENSSRDLSRMPGSRSSQSNGSPAEVVSRTEAKRNSSERFSFSSAVSWISRYAFSAVSAVLLSMGFHQPVWVVAPSVLAIHTVVNRYEFIKIFFKTIKRDLIGYGRYLRLLLHVRYFQRHNETVTTVFEQFVRKHPDKACIIFENNVWTYRMVNDLSNKVAHSFEDAGFKPGDTVALLLDNRPEYVAIWLGLAKAGLIIALINYNLKGSSLSHSISIVGSKAVVFGASFAQALDEIRGQLDPSILLYAFDSNTNGIPKWSKDLGRALEKASIDNLSGAQRGGFSDKLLYIYTSGTTGLPKAAVIRHSRYVTYTSGIHFVNKITSDDIVYISLPLYHSAGGITAMGQSLIFGCTVVIRKKFSASAFWKEVCQHQCTVAVYIGEICRYLLAAPDRPEERAHKIRLMYGNGMRPQIWEEFVKRFNVPLISELYGSTEGISNLINYEGVVGAVGFVSVIVPSVYPVALVKVDEEGNPIRGADGFCIRCQPGEPGMFVGLINPNNAVRNFDGYVDKNATQKKIARDVFKRGDAAFLSGDILEMDKLGYLYFRDRTGDTFRWRGENVSTTEVEAVISNVAELTDCVVYGVEVPGSEGRAGMAAILDPDQSLDLVALANGMAKVLPPYARPLFIRIVSKIDMTGTYKLRKIDYQKEGFDLEKVGDDIYFMDPSSGAYVPLTKDLLKKMASGELRL